MHNLGDLAAFFKDDAEDAVSALKSRHPEFFNKSHELEASVRKSLLSLYFRISHRALIAHFKLVEKKISFGAYCQALAGSYLRGHVYSSYPVLSRWMREERKNWEDQHDLILRRLEQDRIAICSVIFANEAMPALDAIKLGMGDAHNGGSTVAVLTFEGGKKLVYKPRSLSVDAHFSDIIMWVNGLCDLRLTCPRQISNEQYGWVEFIPYESCHDAKGIQLFYRRTGGLLCLLYILQASDFHYENIIANGANPVLVDLETFFHPRRLGDAPEESVLRTGLLPTRFTTGNTEGADVSGLADVEGQQGLVARTYLVQDEAGNFTFCRDKGALLGKQNIPMLNGQKVELTTELHDSFKEGFKETYCLILSNRHEFLSKLSAFNKDEVRVLMRNTSTYTHLIDEAHHPTLLLSEKVSKKHFSILTGGWPDPSTDKISDYEARCLENRDIPLFTTQAGSLDLKFGDRSIENFYLSSGYDVVLDNVKNLSTADLTRQLWLIDRVLRLKTTARKSPLPQKAVVMKPDYPRSSIDPGDLRGRFRDLAAEAAQFITDQMHHGVCDVSWIVARSATLGGREQQVSSPLYDLHTGMPGEIMFLSEASKQIPGEWGVVAEKSYRSLMRMIDKNISGINGLGMFTGWGGIIYLHTSLAEINNDQSLIDQVERLLQVVEFTRLIDGDRSFSLLSGAAGLMWALSSYYMTSGSRKALALALTAAEHLLANRDEGGPGHSWRISSASPLTGLAHGASGFAVAFARLYQACGDPAFRTASLEAVAYERAFYSPEDRNWRDLRDYTLKQGGLECATTWAHGAPGIGLARLSLLRSGIDNSALRQELDVAMETTLAFGIQGQSSLVAGALGNLELPLSYAEQINRKHWPRTLELLCEAERFVENSLLVARTKGIAPFGLMTGITGLGYQCLRIAGGTSTTSFLNLNSTLTGIRT